MTETVKSKVYSIKNFVAAGEHEHYISADTLKLLHNGDFVRLSVKGMDAVKSITVKATTVFTHHTSGLAGASQTKRDTKTIKIDSSGDYEWTVKEQYQSKEGTGAGLILGATYVDNMDATITLDTVDLLDGGSGKIGQDPTTNAGIEWDTIISACTWVLGITGLLIGGYVAYRVYRWHWHGEALFPRLTKMLHGGE